MMSMKGNVLLISGTVRPYFEARTNKLRLRILNGSNARILSTSFAQGCTFVAADMVGYSRLTAANEEGSLTRLQAVRVGLIDPAIAAAGGRIGKNMGDGLLVLQHDNYGFRARRVPCRREPGRRDHPRR